MGGTEEVQNCLFAVKQVVTAIINHRVKAIKDFPSQGFVGVGSFDQNWGWLRYLFLSIFLSFFFQYHSFTLILLFQTFSRLLQLTHHLFLSSVIAQPSSTELKHGHFTLNKIFENVRLKKYFTSYIQGNSVIYNCISNELTSHDFNEKCKIYCNLKIKIICKIKLLMIL